MGKWGGGYDSFSHLALYSNEFYCKLVIKYVEFIFIKCIELIFNIFKYF